MRTEDRRRLEQPYGAQDPGERALANVLGVSTPNLDRLSDEILADLVVDTPYGIGWWAPHPGTSRRILISDQLHSCVTTVATNLVEAALHQLEYLDYADQESDHLANAVRLEGRELRVRMPRNANAAEDAIHRMAELHAVGVARALSAALDCLGGVIVAVLALPTSILKSDLDRARQALTRLPADNTEGRRRQLDARARLDGFIQAAGPDGWLPWLLAFRNMLVHRGRRIVISQLVPRTPVLHGPDGRPMPRMNVVRQLPRDAGRSDIEVFLDRAAAPVLTEDSTRTIEGVIRSAHTLVENAAELLLEVWRWRRRNPAELVQPREQWPNGPAPQETVFRGYAEGTRPYDPNLLTGHPVLLKRMRAASLPDPVRNQWRTFD